MLMMKWVKRFVRTFFLSFFFFCFFFLFLSNLWWYYYWQESFFFALFEHHSIKSFSESDFWKFQLTFKDFTSSSEYDRCAYHTTHSGLRVLKFLLFCFPLIHRLYSRVCLSVCLSVFRLSSNFNTLHIPIRLILCEH